jgi:RES domain-containing protein
MIVYRISSRQYAQDLSGEGASLYGGRWNPPGIRLLYTAGSISLACLEYLAHNFHVMASQNICLTKIRMKEPVPLTAHTTFSLPDGWNEKTYIPASTRKIGMDFVNKAQAYALKVPSAIVPGEYNFLLNPLHLHHIHTVIEERVDPFTFDSRLFGG